MIDSKKNSIIFTLPRTRSTMKNINRNHQFNSTSPCYWAPPRNATLLRLRLASVRFFCSFLFLGLVSYAVPAVALRTTVSDESTKVSFEQSKDVVSVKIGDELFTNLIYQGYDKPIFYPIDGPGQIGMTRNWPMNGDVEGEAHDHPHHKSLWFAHEINDADFWSEAGGKIQVVDVELKSADNLIRTKSNWIRKDNETIVCSDTTDYRFGADEVSRWIDATFTINATQGDVVWEDTKEGTFAIRTHPDLRLTASPQAGVPEVFGTAVNSEGDSGKSIWGKAAKWVLYSGPIDGTPMAIAVFDHPKNLRHPTTWHARDYGLVAANPFGLHDFQGEPAGSGEYKVKQGDSLTLRYRAVFFKGEPTMEDVNQRFDEFAE